MVVTGSSLCTDGWLYRNKTRPQGFRHNRGGECWYFGRVSCGGWIEWVAEVWPST